MSTCLVSRMAACAALSLAVTAAAAAQAPAGVRMFGTVPTLVSSSTLLGPVAGTQSISFDLTLPLHGDVEGTLHDLYDINSPTHGQFLTSQQFTDLFGPTQADYNSVVQYVESTGLVVTQTIPSRTIVSVSGDAETVDKALGVHLMRYQAPSGSEFYAPDADPVVDSSVAKLLSGVIGLDDAFNAAFGNSGIAYSSAMISQIAPGTLWSSPVYAPASTPAVAVPESGSGAALLLGLPFLFVFRRRGR